MNFNNLKFSPCSAVPKKEVWKLCSVCKHGFLHIKDLVLHKIKVHGIDYGIRDIKETVQASEKVKLGRKAKELQDTPCNSRKSVRQQRQRSEAADGSEITKQTGSEIGSKCVDLTKRPKKNVKGELPSSSKEPLIDAEDEDDKCNRCGKTENMSHYNFHPRSAPGKGVPVPTRAVFLKCPICSRIFICPREFSAHQLLHKKECICSPILKPTPDADAKKTTVSASLCSSGEMVATHDHDYCHSEPFLSEH